MTLLTGVLDPGQQGNNTSERSRELAPGLPWLTHRHAQIGALSLSLDASPETPYSTFQSRSGRNMFVLGDALSSNGPCSAASLEEECLKHGVEDLARLNGYYLVGMVDENNAIHLAGDQLGLMPIYYWADENRFAFSTSPNAFLNFPGFNAKPDPMGIAASLLTMHATGNRTVWQDVKRLPPGHLLRWQEGKGVQLTSINPLKADDKYFGWSLERCQELIQNSFNESVLRFSRLGETSMLLSGGLDSRLVAGCLRWHARYKAPVVTLGNAADYEMQCARRVARSLGWPMSAIRVNLEDYPSWAEVQARLEGSQTSFVEFMWWQALEALRSLKPRIMTGLLGDPVMGVTQVAYAFNEQSGKHEFATQFARMNRYGFSPGEVSALLRQPGLGEAVVEELHQAWSSHDGLPFQKCWLFDLHHRQRLHVGPAAWRLSFGAWPTLPYTDKALLQVMAGMAMPAMAGRRAQTTMLCSKFPRLAALPLDRVGPDIRPVQPKAGWMILHRLSSLPGTLNHDRTAERRQYVRHFNVSGPGWEAVRHKAEIFRPLANRLFDPEVLETVLPPPGQALTTPDPIIDGARYKTLLGLMMHLGLSSAGGNPWTHS